jgi:hypothetical protein
LDNPENFGAFNFAVNGGTTWRLEQSVVKQLLKSGLQNVSDTCDASVMAKIRDWNWIA